ncbi:NAD-dependent epimerase/dehydratase family protein [Spongiactinospora sp. TRM90649]|uniref:NAD-dependent epimerase/dehydratase family protein n=1 Tax=Spongiactinospora sp. TRM90649 TaxID=3031114 RepID=UPI0023F856DD|nr:NAD-dependent epimerase/dehydratase family protein [Spongiactinospora sp. TRM90649]MDF5753700.1 NAD-dependent epimerase/dehydratase family protein [Spongiactinospora sp. TRM90649]
MRTVAELEERLALPSAGLAEDLGGLDGDLMILGAGGKLGPSLVRLALNAVQGSRRVIAVSRFSESGLADSLQEAGATVVRADVADERALAGLPDAANVVFLVGAKFGTQGREHTTWFTNTYLPGRVAERFRGARIAALSTGNVYPLVPVTSGGSTEDSPAAPVGEYAMSCLGRERVMAHFAETHGTPLALIRLNYAVEMRYGVLVDLAQRILAGEPVDLATGQVNVVWQGYANEVTLRALRLADVPPYVLNVTGPELISVRQAAQALGAALGKEPVFTGQEAPTALLSNASRCHRLFGYPALTPAELIEHTARWVAGGGPLLGKPTKFERRDGRF